jgi:putative transcriptional regulator
MKSNKLGTPMKTHLRKLRFLNGELSQQDLANQVKVSRQTIIAIERGDYSPSVKLALMLARKFNTTVEQLFELEDTDNA